jgi:hypothetical protein
MDILRPIFVTQIDFVDTTCPAKMKAKKKFSFLPTARWFSNLVNSLLFQELPGTDMAGYLKIQNISIRYPLDLNFDIVDWMWAILEYSSSNLTVGLGVRCVKKQTNKISKQTITTIKLKKCTNYQ